MSTKACKALVALSAVFLSGTAWADHGPYSEEELEEEPPRLFSEIARVIAGLETRVDGDAVVGLHVAATMGQGVPPYGDGEGFGLAAISESVSSWRALSVHGRTAAAVGFGSNRIFGVLEQTLDAGVRIPFGPLPLGFYARAGVDAGAFGDSRLYTSRVTFPYGRAGLSLMLRRSLLEIGVAGGPVLAGRFNVGDFGVRPLHSTVEVGPTLLFTSRVMELAADIKRIGAEDTGTGRPVILARGMACGLMRGFGVGLCMQLSYGQGDVFQRDERTDAFARSFFAGWTVGYQIE